jgi:hypothetical protein
VSFLHFHRRDGPGEGERQPLEARPSWEAALSGETEAFLEGRLVEHLVAAGRKVPAWAVLNKVAHASVRELADLVETDAGTGSAGVVAGPLWLSAQRSLASRLVGCGARPDEIKRVQRAVLVPLELWLIERSKVETVTPRQVIGAAWDALNEGPSLI